MWRTLASLSGAVQQALPVCSSSEVLGLQVLAHRPAAVADAGPHPACAQHASASPQQPHTLQRRWHSQRIAAADHNSVVPADILQPLLELEAQLRRQSHWDGTKRLDFSHDRLPFALPTHQVEAGLYTIPVHVRALEGSLHCKWLRRAGRTPCRIQSLPDNKCLNLHMSTPDAIRMVSKHGRHNCQAQVFALQILNPTDPSHILATVRVKPQFVHMTSTKQQVENIDFMYVPRHRVVRVDVPVRLLNDDVAPGIRKGGWMHITQRTVRYEALGHSIPPFIEVDVKDLDLHEAVRVRHLPIPPNTLLPQQDYNKPVVVCTSSSGND